MECDDLVVFEGKVMPGFFQVRHLHEKPSNKAATNVRVVLLVMEVCANHNDVQSLHGPLELFADALCAFQRSRVDVIVVAERARVHALSRMLLVRVENVQHREMVAIKVRKALFAFVGVFRSLFRPHENHGHTEHGCNGKSFVRALVLRRVDEHLRKLRVQRKLRGLVPTIREVSVVIQAPEEIQHLQRAHQRFRCRRVEEVEMHEVVDAQLFERKDNDGQVGPQDLRVGLLREFRLESFFRVQPEALARLRSACAACSLRRGSLRHRRNK
mmetsp:Transcript_89402/g.251768  ORF Transcript_89402/g.251768 Transcript_89402/m.251768 type:complete len:271 (+) Transcript_89402:275-1087(+)